MIPYELRIELIRRLSRLQYFKGMSDVFVDTLRDSGLSLSDVTNLADLFPDVDFPPKSKSARSSFN